MYNVVFESVDKILKIIVTAEVKAVELYFPLPQFFFVNFLQVNSKLEICDLQNLAKLGASAHLICG